MSITGIGITAGGSNTKSTIIVTIDSGSTVTCSKGEIVKTAIEKNGQWRFNNIDNGTWIITATKGNLTETQTVEITKLSVYYVEMQYFIIYGISRDINSSSPVWTRTDSSIGLTATASIGNQSGHSDFDSCYPWSEMKIETFSTGDVMVKIPKFYFRRYIDDNIEYIKVASKEADGFKLHPAFNHANKETDYIYVGAYKTFISQSVPNAMPSPWDNVSRATFRDNAKSKGTGWSMWDISVLSAIQILIMIEFASSDVQSVIGRGYVDNTGTAGIATGSTNNVANLTGRAAGTNGLTDVVWRGIEGLWGSWEEYVDGINLNNGTYYICNDPSKYKDDTSESYTALSFNASTNWMLSYITKEGLDTNNEHVLLPSSAGTGSSSTHYCDVAIIGTTGWGVLGSGGSWNSGSGGGLFYIFVQASSTVDSRATRLLYIP